MLKTMHMKLQGMSKREDKEQTLTFYEMVNHRQNVKA